MIRLLSINNYFYRRGGAEAVFFEHNSLFEQIGWEVVPFCMKHPLNIQTRWSEFFVDEIEFGAEYSIFEKLLRVPKVIYSLEARRKLEALISRVRPDVCHAHNIYHHISPSILGLLKERRIPTLLTLHDLKIACPNYLMISHDGICERCKGGHLYQVIAQRCVKNSLPLSTMVFAEAVVHRWLRTYTKNVDRLIVPSRFHLRKLVEWGWDEERFSYVPNFVRTESLEPNFKPGRTFVYFGRLAPEKGLRTLVRAAALAKVKVVLVGSGPEENSLRLLADEVGADVELPGYMTGSTLHDLIRSARAIVLPSEVYENAPLSIMEAYGLGKPVIGSALGGIPELVMEGQTGRIFDAGNVESLAGAMSHFAALADDLVAAMGRAGRRWMEQDFSPSRYRERLLGIYGDLGVDSTR